MIYFKKKLSQFYGKSFSKESRNGGFFDIKNGEFLKHNFIDFDFSRVDGIKRNTEKTKKYKKLAEQQFYKNLELLGIIKIDCCSDFRTWIKIADFFTNDDSPVIKKLWQRHAWARDEQF